MIEEVECCYCGKEYDADIIDGFEDIYHEGETIAIRQCPECGSKNAISFSKSIVFLTGEAIEDDSNLEQEDEYGDDEDVE